MTSEDFDALYAELRVEGRAPENLLLALVDEMREEPWWDEARFRDQLARLMRWLDAQPDNISDLEQVALGAWIAGMSMAMRIARDNGHVRTPSNANLS